MKISTDYVIREIAGEYIIVPTGKAAMKLNGMITVNETGVFLWKELQEGTTEEELVSAMCEEFDVDEVTARADVREFLEKLSAEEILEE